MSTAGQVRLAAEAGMVNAFRASYDIDAVSDLGAAIYLAPVNVVGMVMTTRFDVAVKVAST